ncbi:MAG TPA: polyphosphate kinase 2 family protein, partial [Ktedonobacteraceae bacterium]|nr:polyphosphate kinase 2 family protein [Ktedonobacteraceae bacterium]
MATDLLWKVKEGTTVKLKDYDPDYTDDVTDRVLAATLLEKLDDELNELQEMMAAAQHQALLMILQGMDTSGKDGTIRHVLNRVNPQGCMVHSFKQPTQEELAHDFLWRIHKAIPARGVLGV